MNWWPGNCNFCGHCKRPRTFPSSKMFLWTLDSWTKVDFVLVFLAFLLPKQIIVPQVRSQWNSFANTPRCILTCKIGKFDCTNKERKVEIWQFSLRVTVRERALILLFQKRLRTNFNWKFLKSRFTEFVSTISAFTVDMSKSADERKKVELMWCFSFIKSIFSVLSRRIFFDVDGSRHFKLDSFH